jgi:Cu+-exporting ATPase
MVGSGVGLNLGILFKKGSVLEQIAKLEMIFFDKTGTITRGKPEVTGVYPAEGVGRDELLKIAASAENNSSHPVAPSVVSMVQASGIEIVDTQEAEEMSGLGVKCRLGGNSVKVGSRKLMAGAELSEALNAKGMMLSKNGQTTIYISRDDHVIGIIALADVIKPDSKAAMQRLHAAGIKTALISGDNRMAAQAVANEVRIDAVEAEVLPQDKINTVRKWQNKGFSVAMVGDGINDAPAIAQADIGIAIGSGTDVAKETGDVVLVKDSLLDVERAIRLGKKTLKTIKLNFFWAFFYNVLMIPIAAGILYPSYGLTFKPEIASIAMWLSSLSVVGNSLLLKRYESKLRA